MHLGKLLAPVAAFGLVALPAVANAQARIAAPVEETELMGEGGSGMLILGGFLAAMVAFIIILSDDDEGDLPTSP